MSMTVDWNVSELGEISEATIRKLHLPAEAHRVSRAHFPAGVSFSGTGKVATCYVLQGNCEYTFSREAIRLRTGTWATLPEGDYTLAVDADNDLELVLVWKLPQPSPVQNNMGTA